MAAGADDRKYSIYVLFKILDKFSKPLSDLSEGFKKVSGHTKEYKNDIQGLMDVGKKMEQFGRRWSLRITAPLTAIGAFSAKAAMDFNELMSEIHTSIDLPLSSLRELKKEVLDTSIQFGRSKDDVVNGLKETVRSFGMGSDTVERFNVATKAAVAGFTTTGTVIDYVAGAMRAYGDDSVEAMKKFIGYAIYTKTKSKATFEEISQGLGRSLPTAAHMKIAAKDYMAAFATLAQLNPQSVSRVGFQLSTLIENMAKYPELVKSVEEVGFTETMWRLKDAIGGNITAIRQLAGGARSLGGAAHLLGKGFEEFLATSNELKNSINMNDAAFEKVTNRINKSGFVFKQLKALWFAIRVELGDLLLPALEEFWRVLIKVGQWFRGLSDNTKVWVVRLAILAAIIPPIILFFGKFILMAGTLAIAIKGLTFVLGMKGLIGTLGLLLKFIGVPLIVVFLKLLLPIALVAGAIWLLTKGWKNFNKETRSVGGFKLWTDNWQYLGEEIEKVEKKSKNMLNSRMFTKKFWVDLGKFTKDASGAVVTELPKSVWSVVSSVIKGIGGLILAILKTVFVTFPKYVGNVIKQILVDITKDVWSFSKDMATFIKNVVIAVFTELPKSIWTGVKAVLKEIRKALVQISKDIFKDFKSFIVEMVKFIGNVSVLIFKQIVSAISSPLKSLKWLANAALNINKAFTTSPQKPQVSFPKITNEYDAERAKADMNTSKIILKIQNETGQKVSVGSIRQDPNSPNINILNEYYLGFGGAY